MTTPPTKHSTPAREPSAIVFADTPAPAPGLSTAAQGSSQGPSAIDFGSRPSKSAPAPVARVERTTAPSPGYDGPRPIVFADAPAAPMKPPAAPVHPQIASPAAPPKPHSESATPQAVSFGPERAGPAPAAMRSPASPSRVAAIPVMVATPAHPLASSLMAKCLEHQPLNTNEQAVLARFLSQLLPFGSEAVESYGQRNLETCRKHAVAATHENHSYSQLAVSERLQEVLSQSLPSSNLIDRLRSKIKSTVKPGSHNIPMLRSMIEDFLRRNRAMQADFVDDKLRLELATLALKAAVREFRLDDNAPLERTAHQRLSLMEAAVMQARLVETQLKGLEQMASAHLIECDRVSTVTLSAANMANQLKY